MKTFLITIALIGFTAVGSYAQNKACACKKKMVHHGVVHHTGNGISPYSAKPFIPAPTIVATEKVYAEPCYSFRKHNIVVTECPTIFYKNADDGIEYGTENTYMGYYPKKNVQAAEDNISVAPQHITIDDYRGVAPAGGNGCNGCCSAK